MKHSPSKPTDPLYTPFYCEENVWQLARGLKDAPGQRWAIFISNPQKTCALWKQRAAPKPDGPVVWDYHVILIDSRRGYGEGVLVHDLDTTLGRPISADAYLQATFPFQNRIERKFRPHFRVVEAEDYLGIFASDRSHMIFDGAFARPPPDWPVIKTASATMNLPAFIDVKNNFVGKVMDLQGLRDHFEL